MLKLQLLDPDVLTLALKLAPDWVKIIVPDRNPRVVMDFMDFLVLAGQHCLVFLEALAKINEKLVVLNDAIKGSKFKEPIRLLNTKVSSDRWKAFADALHLLEATKLLHLKAFLAKRSRDTHVDLLEGFYFKCCSPDVVHGELAFDGIALVMEKNGFSDNIVDRTIKGLALMSPIKVRADFHGFADWGPGDHGNPQANLEGHFDKHVLGKDNDIKFRVWEMAKWWHALGLQLTKDEYTKNSNAPQPGALQLFPQQGNLLDGNFQALAQLIDPISAEPNLVQLLKAKLQKAYGEFAIAQSKVLTETLVHGNEQKVFLSGCISAISLFIIGRVDGNTLGISSCYFVPPGNMPAKLDDRKRFWPLL
jgi:hypothetical protein